MSSLAFEQSEGEEDEWFFRGACGVAVGYLGAMLNV